MNKPIWWRDDICTENNVHVVVGKEDYFLSADGRIAGGYAVGSFAGMSRRATPIRLSAMP
jgi:hypothetical protein